jgi:hypothetical protein
VRDSEQGEGLTVVSEEDVDRFDVSMNDIGGMEMRKRETNLRRGVITHSRTRERERARQRKRERERGRERDRETERVT